MNSDRLYEFFITDDHARWRCASWSIGVAGAASALAAILGVRDDVDIAITSGLVSTAAFGAQLYLYVTAPSPDLISLPGYSPARRKHLRLALISATIASLGILESWLRGMASQYALANESRREISRILPPVPASEAPASTRPQESFQSTQRSLGSEPSQTIEAVQSPEPLSLQDFAGMDQKTFAESLSRLQKAAFHSVPVNTDQSTLSAIAAKLRTTPESSPEYWPTVLQFIRFASSKFNPDVPPPGKPTVIFADNKGFGLSATYKKRIVLLDGGDLGSRVRFENSRIIFTENPVRMRGVQFVNCVFELPDGPTNPYLRKAAQELLASNLTEIPSL